jgi:hypothetical protein
VQEPWAFSLAHAVGILPVVSDRKFRRCLAIVRLTTMINQSWSPQSKKTRRYYFSKHVFVHRPNHLFIHQTIFLSINHLSIHRPFILIQGSASNTLTRLLYRLKKHPTCLTPRKCPLTPLKEIDVPGTNACDGALSPLPRPGLQLRTCQPQPSPCVIV